VDKLTQIYGSGSSQIGNVANISGHNFNPSKKVQPQVADSLRSIAGIYEICKFNVIHLFNNFRILILRRKQLEIITFGESFAPHLEEVQCR
jgi:hypothetical protein